MMDFMWPANNRQFQLWLQGLSYLASPKAVAAPSTPSPPPAASQSGAAKGVNVKEGGMTVGRERRRGIENHVDLLIRRSYPPPPPPSSSTTLSSYRSVTRSLLDRDSARRARPRPSIVVASHAVAARPIWSTSTYPRTRARGRRSRPAGQPASQPNTCRFPPLSPVSRGVRPFARLMTGSFADGGGGKFFL